MHNLKLLAPVKNRIFLHFFTKNAKYVKLKKNTVAVKAGIILVYFKGQKGVNTKLLRRLQRLKKKRIRNWKLKFPTEHIGDYFFIEKVKARFVTNFVKIITKLIHIKPFPIFEFYYKTLEKSKKINFKKNRFIIMWHSERASLKKILLTLKLEFKNYLEYKSLFVMRIEFVYKKNATNMFVDVSFKCNRVYFIVCLNKNHKKEFCMLKDLFCKKGFQDMILDHEEEKAEIVNDSVASIDMEIDAVDHYDREMYVVNNLHKAWKNKIILKERRLFLAKFQLKQKKE